MALGLHAPPTSRAVIGSEARVDDHYVTMKDFGPGKSTAGNSAVLLEMGAARLWLELGWAQRRRSRTQSGTVTWLHTQSGTVPGMFYGTLN